MNFKKPTAKKIEPDWKSYYYEMAKKLDEQDHKFQELRDLISTRDQQIASLKRALKETTTDLDARAASNRVLLSNIQ